MANMDATLNAICLYYINEPYSASKYDADVPGYRKMMWGLVRRFQEDGGELWYSLDKTNDAHILWQHLRMYHLEVLTATGPPEYGAQIQKARWFAKHFCDKTKMNFTRKAADKAAFASSGHLLIDDSKRAIDPWIEQGGIGILHTTAVDTINQLIALESLQSNHGG